MFRKILLICILFLSVIKMNSQVFFSERAILKESDNFSAVSYEKISTSIEENDSLYHIKSQDGMSLSLKRDASSFRLIGDKYDIISLDAGKYGFCSVEMLEDDKKCRYKLQYRFYSKNKNRWVGDYILFFLFKYDENGFPNGERIIFKKSVK